MAYDWPLMGETITLGDRFAMAKFALTAKKFTQGEQCEAFEKEWSRWLGTEHSLFVSSGSTANMLMISAVMERGGLRPGDKVLLPACTWMTNVAPPIQLGLSPVFCDINLFNFSFDEEMLKTLATLHPDIKLVFVSHLLGFPGTDHAYLKELWPKAYILDDVCESHGAELGPGKKVGSESLGASFSFYFGHHMSTIEGGMVSTNDEDFYDLMKMKRSHGLARTSKHKLAYEEGNPHIDPQFLFMTDGYNFRNHEICAVLGRRQLKRLDSMIMQRNDNYMLFYKNLHKASEYFHVPDWATNMKRGVYDHLTYNSSFCLPFVCKTDEIYNILKKVLVDNSIEYRPIVGGNLLDQPFLLKYKQYAGPMPNAELIQKRGLYVGNNHMVDATNIIELWEKINAVF